MSSCADGMQGAVSNNGPVLPAFAYGMNLQLLRGQPQTPREPFRILTTCSWEQNAYTVKIYVPLHGVKTDLLRAVFQPHTLDIKAINLQVGIRDSVLIAHSVFPVVPSCTFVSVAGYCCSQQAALMRCALCLSLSILLRRAKTIYLALSRHTGPSILTDVQLLPARPRRTF